ncbi:DNA (cytosine-5-)-methyltransferase [Alphaproteobacteria bacterium]|nr:DNA (cytosine-5-)-methyltransferase [Alphaproteobacteria bacterium]
MRVIELFAGVGGFRLGLEAAGKKNYEIVWSNQWEPSTKAQPASDIYVARFGKNHHSNEDIARVIESDFSSIPDHDLLVGGFPCQDYSVARTLNQAKGITGKKGVLWWSIHDILEKKGVESPSYLMLENVDRLLKSPTKQRGRDFAVMLASLSDLGYSVEWRVINAADFGMPQRRRRVYIMAYKDGTVVNEQLKANSVRDWLLKNGLMQKAFPTQRKIIEESSIKLVGSLADISEKENLFNDKTPFLDCGLMTNRQVTSLKTKPKYTGKKVTLGDVLLADSEIDFDFWISENELEKWKYLKGAKREMRTTKDGFEYSYAEGPVGFPDVPERPSRTIITGEGGRTASRFKHVVLSTSGRFRRLMPVELERLNMFPDHHTKEATDTKRAFFMGNALVVGVVTKLAKQLVKFQNMA